MTKQQALNRIEKQYKYATEKLGDLGEYIKAIAMLPPRGEGAKYECSQEIVDVTSRLREAINVIRKKLIELINWEETKW